jgi:transcriptional regulator with XRE-family HTH domain
MGMSLDVSKLLALLSDKLSTKAITQQEIQQATGVHQSQISRIVAGKSKRVSPNVKKLCKYAEALRTSRQGKGSADAEVLQASILAIWDGSSAHARALQEVIHAIGAVQSTVLGRR